MEKYWEDKEIEVEVKETLVDRYNSKATRK